LAGTPGEVTRLLNDLKQGKEDSVSKLMSLVYKELHRLAEGFMRREPREHTLQPTALVHEAYLKLVDQRAMNWQNRAHFFAVSARLMRRILVDHARGRRSAKRGGKERPVSLEDAPTLISLDRSDELLALDEVLKKLEETAPRQCRIVELRYFGGLTVEETASVLNVAPKTVKRDWSVARAWLHREISRHGKDESRAVGEAGGAV
jgi:RNA polymerase sigma factor (TIGR02999 family)